MLYCILFHRLDMRECWEGRRRGGGGGLEYVADVGLWVGYLLSFFFFFFPFLKQTGLCKSKG